LSFSKTEKKERANVVRTILSGKFELKKGGNQMVLSRLKTA